MLFTVPNLKYLLPYRARLYAGTPVMRPRCVLPLAFLHAITLNACRCSQWPEHLVPKISMRYGWTLDISRCRERDWHLSMSIEQWFRYRSHVETISASGQLIRNHRGCWCDAVRVYRSECSITHQSRRARRSSSVKRNWSTTIRMVNTSMRSIICYLPVVQPDR